MKENRDEYINKLENSCLSICLSEREKAVECIKALSRIEGCLMTIEGLNRTPALYDNIGYVMKYFDELLGELDR